MSTQDLSAADEVAAAIGDYIDAAIREQVGGDGTTTAPPPGEDPVDDPEEPAMDEPTGDAAVTLNEVKGEIARHLQDDPHPTESEIRAIVDETLPATGEGGSGGVTEADVNRAIEEALAETQFSIRATRTTTPVDIDQTNPE